MSSDKPFSRYFYNPVTYLGVVIALTIFVLEIMLFVFDFMAHGDNLYLGLVTFVMLPPGLLFGLALIPLGALWKRRALRKRGDTRAPEPLRIDLSRAHHRNAVLVFLVGTSVLIFMSLIGSYMGYHYTESTAFCGTLCHQVMQPEYTTYLQSAHARVKCVECHIGPGADWYVKSKLSGVRQIFKTLQGTYPRPIPTPVHNLRPARDTCLECHWAEKPYHSYDFRRTYYQSGEDGDQTWHLRMLLPVGGELGKGAGVHDHMNLEQDIYYAADDERRQEISWVKSVSRDGRETIYTTPDSPYRDTAPPAERIRKMDCIDCHSRPSHQFLSPVRLVNESMHRGDLPADVPAFKGLAVEVLSEEYASTEEAMEKIREAVAAFYRETFGEEFEAHAEQAESSARTLQTLFSRNMFPEMKANWTSSPNHIGHMITPGCFRCHDGNHQSGDGKVIVNDCASCHLIVEQGPDGAVQKNLDGLEFVHPGGEGWEGGLCSDCHSGGG